MHIHVPIHLGMVRRKFGLHLIHPVGFSGVTDLNFNMQQTTLFKAMIGHILMSMRHHGPTRQQSIAMLAMFGNGIGLVNGLIARWCQKFSLGHFRPMLEILFLAPVHFANFLKAHNVGVQLLNGQAQVVNL